MGRDNNLVNEPDYRGGPVGHSRACSTRITGLLPKPSDMNGAAEEGEVVGGRQLRADAELAERGSLSANSTVRTISNLIVDQSPGQPGRG